MKKYSHQREAIREALMSVKTHPTAAEIYDMVREHIPNISLGTVYRNLSMLAAEGEILRISTGEGTERYDATTASHCHFVCSQCGGVSDLDLPSDDLDRMAEMASGSSVERHSLIFYGTCAECISERREPA